MLEDSTAETTLELRDLRTDTEYNIDIIACYDEDCADMLIGEPMQAPSWRTEIESWFFPDINGGYHLTVMFSNAYAPALIDLSELPINEDGWVLTNIQNDESESTDTSLCLARSVH